VVRKSLSLTHLSLSPSLSRVDSQGGGGDAGDHFPLSAAAVLKEPAMQRAMRRLCVMYARGGGAAASTYAPTDREHGPGTGAGAGAGALVGGPQWAPDWAAAAEVAKLLVMTSPVAGAPGGPGAAAAPPSKRPHAAAKAATAAAAAGSTDVFESPALPKVFVASSPLAEVASYAHRLTFVFPRYPAVFPCAAAADTGGAAAARGTGGQGRPGGDPRRAARGAAVGARFWAYSVFVYSVNDHD